MTHLALRSRLYVAEGESGVFLLRLAASVQTYIIRPFFGLPKAYVKDAGLYIEKVHFFPDSAAHPVCNVYAYMWFLPLCFLAW
jgi:hypothetical protein